MTNNMYKFAILISAVILCATNVLATNFGRNIYGILSENYNGVTGDSSGGIDQVTYTDIRYNYSDFVEGRESIEVRAGEYPKVTLVTGQMLTDYTGGYIYFSARVPSMTIDKNSYFAIRTNKEHPVGFNNTAIQILDTSGTGGIVADNTWHTYRIPFSAFANQFNQPCTLVFGVSSKSGNPTILIDNVYWTKGSDTSKSFSVTVKNISDNVEVDTVTWNQSCYQKSWIAADQYIELDLDWESINWNVRIYLDNGDIVANGLCAIDGDTVSVLPMAWRIRPDTLPNAAGDTLLIARTDYGSYGLYDVGKNPSGTDWYTWCPMRDKSETFDDMKIWDLRGIHTVVWDHDSFDTLRDYYEKKPKVYFAADCTNAIGGLEYTTNIVFELYYE